MNRVGKQTAAWYAVSSWLARAAGDALGGRPVGTAPMPAATSLFEPSRVTVRHEQRMLFVGRLNAQKGVDDLLQAVARSKRGWTLDIVGDGPDKAALVARAVALGITDRVRWLGHLAQTALAPLYCGAAAVVIPSINEGLGLVGVEAGLCETPSVGYASGGLTDVVKDGVTGWLVPPGDAARVHALATFSPEAVGARYRAIYDGLLGVPA
jgi:glycosyltransferase involved in cell wall biosynthesis